MKKIIIPVLVISLMLSLTGCADNGASGRVMNQSTGIKDVIQSGIASENEKTAPAASTSETTGETSQTPVTVAPPDPDSHGEIDEKFKGTKGIDIACRKTGQLPTKAHINTVEFKSGTARPRAHSRTART